MENNQQKYKVVLSNSVSAVLFTTLDGEILEVNQAAVSMFGYNQEEFVKLSRKDIIDQTDEILPKLLVERTLKGTVKGELKGIRKNGEKFPLRFSSTIFEDDDGMEYCYNSILDISDRKKSEQEMALMINNTEEAFVLLDVNLCVISFNTQFQNVGKRYFGFDIKNGDYLLDYAQKTQLQALQEFYAVVLKGTKRKKGLEIIDDEGNVKYFSLTYTPTIDEDSKVTGIFISSRDITEETLSQLAIKETESELEKIMNSSLDVICTIDIEGNFVKISNASEKVWGFMPDELVGKKFIEYVHPEDVDESKNVFLEVIAGFEQTNFQNRYIKKDRTIVPIIWSAKWDDTEKIMYCIAKDGTEKEKQETTIIESRKLYKNLFESSPAPMFVFDFETLQIIDCNKETLLKYGYTKEEFLDLTLKDIILPEDRTEIEKLVFDEATDGQNHQHVWRHQKKNGDIMFMEINGHFITYNDRKMSLVILIDITEKLKIEEQREFEKRDKEALINSTNDLIWSVNKNFKLLAANQAFVKNLEQNIGVAIKVGDDLLIENVYPKAYLDFWKSNYTRALNGESFIEEVKSPSDTEQTEVWYDITFNPIYKEVEIVGIACYARNITENKKIKQELINSEEKYRLLFYSSPLPNWIYDTETLNIVDVNEAAITHYGYSKEEFLSMNHKDLRTEDDFFKRQESINEKMKSPGDSIPSLFTHQKKNGELIQVEVSGHSIFNNGKKSRIVVCNDVTKRENALYALKDREVKLINAQQIAKLGYWQRNIDDKTLFWSSEVYEILGVNKTLKPSFELLISAIHPEDVDSFMKEQNDLLFDKKNMDIEHRIILNDGSIKWVHQKGKLQKGAERKNILLDGTIQDITERKKTEEKLKESIQRYENVTKATSDAIWDWDVFTNKVLWGETFNHLFGKMNDETLSEVQKIKKRLHPDEVELIIQSAKLAIKSHDLNWSYEHRFLKADGSYAHVLNKVLIIRDSSERAIRVIGAMQDISDRKKSEEITRKSNERFELIGKAANDAIWEWDFATNIGWSNLTHQQMFGLTLEDSIPEREEWVSRLHESERENVLQSFQDTINAKSEIFYSEYQLRTENKGWISISDRTYIEYDAFGKMKRKIGSMSDITKRKQEEQLLKLMSSVITNTNDAVLITEAEPFDEPGPKIIYVNEAFTKMTGYSSDEVIGKTPRILQGPKSDKNELARLRKALENWEPCEVTTINYKKNGEEFWINFTISPVADATGWYTHWISIERDITIRKNEELQIELINNISKVFQESIQLHETLDRTLNYVIDFGGFCFAEVWLTTTDKNIINRVSSSSENENIKSFLSKTGTVDAFIDENGIVKIAAKTKELLIWEDLSSEKDFKLGKAAEKIGLKTIMALPLLYNDAIIGVLTFGLDYAILDTGKYRSLLNSLANYLAPEIKRKQLEQELNQLFNFAPDIIAIAGLDGYFKKINPIASELLGYTEEELYAEPFINFIHPDDRNKSSEELAKLPEIKQTFYFENRYITKSGSIKWLAWNAVYALEENNIYAVAKDVTEKKELEDLLQKANELARIGGWEVDFEKNTVFWSDITKEIHEVETEFVPDMQTALSFYKKGKSKRSIGSYFKSAYKTGKAWDDEFQIITGKGNERWIRMIGEVENGNNNRIYGSFQDIDERKKAEEKIKSSEERRKLIMNAALDAIICIDKEGRITFWNPQAERIFGWMASEVIGEILSKLIIPEYYRDMHDSGMDNYLNTGNGSALNVLLQLSAIRRSGEEFPIELTVLPIKQDGEEFFCAFMRDISERKSYETKLIALNEDLKKQKAELVVSNYELEQFAYIASHDLQEPLRMVTSFLTLLNKKYGANFDETATVYIDFAVDGAKRMKELILDLLEYSRVGKSSEIEEFIDLNVLITEIKILFRKQIEEINAEIIVMEQLPLIKSPKSPLFQLFQNLISNALKYSRKDATPTVKISFETYDDYWEFKVADNGIGINENYFEKIFVIFQRLHNKDDYSGTGMGLAITKKIVESLGGKIWLSSNVNIGSEFFFTIPKKSI